MVTDYDMACFIVSTILPPPPPPLETLCQHYPTFRVGRALEPPEH